MIKPIKEINKVRLMALIKKGSFMTTQAKKLSYKSPATKNK